jgi:hypothetical protein
MEKRRNHDGLISCLVGHKKGKFWTATLYRLENPQVTTRLLVGGLFA